MNSGTLRSVLSDGAEDVILKGTESAESRVPRTCKISVNRFSTQYRVNLTSSFDPDGNTHRQVE